MKDRLVFVDVITDPTVERLSHDDAAGKGHNEMVLSEQSLTSRARLNISRTGN